MKLSKEQEKAINHINGPALVLAVPGAGKTTVIIHRTINLIKNHHISPERILSITFSKASAMDMKNRFSSTFLEENRNIKFSTIHSFCFGLIREYAYIEKLQFKLIEDERNKLNKYNLLKQIYMEYNKEYITEEKLESLIGAMGYIKNLMISVDEYTKNNKVDIENFKLIFNAYENYKRENFLLDFDDLLTIAMEILQKNKYLLQKYRNKYDFIQLDEGQDTSKIQMEIIKLLARPKNNLFIVADDDQSIYGFRGAYVEGLFEFNKEYANGKLFYMENNYRSSKNIVSICNKFIKTNKQRYNKEISTENAYSEPINILKFKNITDQYRYIVEELKDKDISKYCVLYRNNLSAIGLVEIFERYNISFYMRDTKLRFFNHWFLSDILNFMKFALDNSKIEIYENIYYKTKGYISKKHISFAKTLDYNVSVFDRIMEYPGLTEYYKRTLRELKLDFRRLSRLKPKEAIEYIECDMEYDDYLKENSAKNGLTYENLKIMLFYLKLIAKRTDNLNEFVGRLKHLQHLCRNSSDNKNAITLSTIHSAKGLEFDNVFIIDLIEGDFPTISSIEAMEKGNFLLLEEERRLFYVGMTRAKNRLSLMTVKNIEEKSLEISRFINELESLWLKS